jgi:hypothetical protein
MLVLMAGIVLSFLPQRWRRRWSGWEVDAARGGMLSGAVEALGCLAVLGWRYIVFLDQRMQAVSGALYSKGNEMVMADQKFQFGAGIFTLLEYMVLPLTWVLIYFIIEGLLRFSAALVSGEVVGTMPLHLIALVQGRISKAAAERAMGPRVPDEVQSVVEKEGELRILSCRPKEGWNNLMTVSYKDTLYEVAGQQEGAPPRRFVYLLRPKPEGKIVRGLCQYDPEEPVKK